MAIATTLTCSAKITNTVLHSVLLLLLCPPSFLCWLGLKHGYDWVGGWRGNHVELWSFNWWLHVIARAKRISSDLVKFGKKCSPLKRIHLPLILLSGSQSCSLDPQASTICCGSVSKNTSYFTSYPLSFEYEGLPSS